MSESETMEAIILAGGMGTRLRSVIKDIPKPMAPIHERPFLSLLLDELAEQGFQHVILSTGYRHEVIEEYFGQHYQGMQLSYSREDEPLGTGGAVRKAFQKVSAKEVFLLNGDTMFRVDLKEMQGFHHQQKADLTMALKPMQDSSRYGVVETEDYRVVGFHEKRSQQSGLINGGIYLLGQHLYDHLLTMDEKFSFERDFMEVHYRDLKMLAFSSDAYFVDIGIPEDYERAHQELIVQS